MAWYEPQACCLLVGWLEISSLSLRFIICPLAIMIKNNNNNNNDRTYFMFAVGVYRDNAAQAPDCLAYNKWSLKISNKTKHPTECYHLHFTEEQKTGEVKLTWDHIASESQNWDSNSCLSNIKAGALNHWPRLSPTPPLKTPRSCILASWSWRW